MDFDENELTTEQWFTVLKNMQSWLGNFNMVFTGGEALLRSDTVQILEHAVSLGIQVELLTNGIVVTDKLAERIVATGISQVTLSYDGINSDTHDRFRGNVASIKRHLRQLTLLCTIVRDWENHSEFCSKLS